MGIITSAMRSNMADSTFLLPDKRMFPVPDVEHAEKAIELAPSALHAGSITQAEYDHVVSAARAYIAKRQ